MTPDRPGKPDWEEMPPVSRRVATVAGALSSTIAGATRALTARIPTTALVMIVGALSVALFVVIIARGIAVAPDAGGIATAVFAAVFGTLLFALGGLSLVLWLRGPRSTAAASEPASAGELETLLAPILRELTAVRTEVAARVRERSVARVPGAMAIAAGLWGFSQWGDDPPGLLMLVGWLVLAALAGEAWAMHGPSDEYRRLYKARVLPVLAARFGDLTYQPGSGRGLQVLETHRIFERFDGAVAEDEISGTYRHMPVRLVEITVTRGSGDDEATVFDGLLVELVLPRRLTGTTAIVAGKGRWDTFLAEWKGGGLERVKLEDPRFEEQFRVYGSDQIEARALLTPAFMERFAQLAASHAFALPGAVAQGNVLLVAVPKKRPTNLFEPPAYWQRAGGRALVALSDDVAAVLKMADAVIDLDFWARGRAGGAGPTA